MIGRLIFVVKNFFAFRIVMQRSVCHQCPISSICGSLRNMWTYKHTNIQTFRYVLGNSQWRRAGLGPQSLPLKKFDTFVPLHLLPLASPGIMWIFKTLLLSQCVSLLCKLYIPTLKLFWDVELGLVFVVEVTMRSIFVVKFFFLLPYLNLSLGYQSYSEWTILF